MSWNEKSTNLDHHNDYQEQCIESIRKWTFLLHVMRGGVLAIFASAAAAA